MGKMLSDDYESEGNKNGDDTRIKLGMIPPLGKNITIPVNEYFDLKMARERLKLLNYGGVDNWDWYGESLYGDDLEENIDAIEKRLRKEILGE